MPTYVYPDHNFLIKCRDTPAWLEIVLAAIQRGTVKLVLSPWHFYECGNTREEEREALLDVVEEISPVWTFERSDFQALELANVWNSVWGYHRAPLERICTLADVSAILHRVDPIRTRAVTLRDYARIFSTIEPDGVFITAMAELTEIAALNRKSYRQGQITTRVKGRIDRTHVATKLAILEGVHPTHVSERAQELRSIQPLSTQIDCFVDWGMMKHLHSFQIEQRITDLFYLRNAKLGRNRFVDRNHAITALCQCDTFVTNDIELFETCTEAQLNVPFPTASVVTCEDFIESLADGKGRS